MQAAPLPTPESCRHDDQYQLLDDNIYSIPPCWPLQLEAEWRHPYTSSAMRARSISVDMDSQGQRLSEKQSTVPLMKEVFLPQRDDVSTCMSYRHRREVCPCWTTVAAWDRWPRRESNSLLFVQNDYSSMTWWTHQWSPTFVRSDWAQVSRY